MEKFNRKRDVTPQFISLNHQPHLFVELTDKPTRVKAGELGKGEDGLVPVVSVVNLETGEAGLLILPTVFERVLADVEDPKGLRYELEDRGIREGKNYRDVRVWELD